MANEEKKTRILELKVVHGKHIIELQLPHVFVAFPITKAGVAQMLEDLDNAIQEIVNEEEQLSMAEN